MKLYLICQSGPPGEGWDDCTVLNLPDDFDISGAYEEYKKQLADYYQEKTKDKIRGFANFLVKEKNIKPADYERFIDEE